MATTSGSILGNPVLRKEDPGILTGQTRYYDDLEVPGLLHAAFVRSTIAHAKLDGIDTSEAKTAPGVVAVYTAADLDLPDNHGFMMLPPTMNRPPLAKEKVRFVGDIITVVIAESKAAATDAAEMVIVDYDPLPAIVDPAQAAADTTNLIHEAQGSNVANAMGTGPVADVFDDADVVVQQRIVNQRLAAAPMEPNGIVVVPGEPTGGMTFWVASQGPHGVRDAIAGALGLDPSTVRGTQGAVGGGFGAKQGMYPEHLISAKVALLLDRPVKWTEGRSENMVAMWHGRGHVHDVEIGVKRDGTITGLRVSTLADAGAYPTIGAFLPFFTQMMSSNVYAIPKIEFNWSAAVTNTTPIAAYRGAGRPEAIHLTERILDIAADELGIDPAEIRRKNFIPPEAFPFMPNTGLGATYDSGEYEKTLDVALERSGYEALRALEQAARRDRGDRKLMGIGVASYLEMSAPMVLTREFGAVEIDDDGKVIARVGTSAHGQGHETAFAQVISSVLGVSFDDITVLHSDTAEVKRGGGTGGSRSLQIGGSALFKASEEVLAQAKQLAAHLLEASPDDVVVGDGGLEVAGVPASRLSWADLAGAVKDPARRPEGMAERLQHELDFDASGSSFPFGSHVAVVEIDADTGRVDFVQHIAVDDCGNIVNPLIVAGQQHGGIAQGVAQVLFEEVQYDADGNPITANFMDYAVPSAAELPSYDVSNTVTPSPNNPLGAKGIGESATIGATPALHNAIVDALSPLGITHVDMPCTAERVWRAIEAARS